MKEVNGVFLGFTGGAKIPNVLISDYERTYEVEITMEQYERFHVMKPGKPIHLIITHNLSKLNS